MRPTYDPHSRRIPPALAFTAGLVFLALAAAAAPPDSTALRRETPANAESPAAGATAPNSGMMAFIDPLTGELTEQPTRQQIETLSDSLKSSLSRSAEGLAPFELASGGRGVHLGGRFQTATVVRRLRDGSWSLACVDHPGKASSVEPTPAPTWEER